MNTIIINQILLIVAIITTGVIYGTDVFYALVMQKASALSKDSSIADVVGHTHLVADKRMPGLGITSVVCTAICATLNFNRLYIASLLGAALLMLLCHLYLYMSVAKPINKQMSDAAINNKILPNIRALQMRWESVIIYRAVLLTAAMILLVITAMICG